MRMKKRMLSASGIILLTLMIGLILPSDAFAVDRVKAARKVKGGTVKKMVEDARLSYPPYQVLIRGFKSEAELEVWGRDKGESTFKKIAVYDVCYLPGELGPKRQQGDLQVPEGVYKVDRFNPWSNFHLSLGIDYPNKSDRILGHPKDPGGDIFIHGNCVSIGCLPITDDLIEELYLIALDSKSKSKRAPAVHIFPCRMDSKTCKATLKKQTDAGLGAPDLWSDLAAIHAAFEKDKKLPSVKIDSKGRYVL